MGTVKVLDVTLRDGGCVNDFNFGQFYMEQILEALENSKVEYIELGYIDQKKGTKQGRTQYCNEQVIHQNFLKSKKRDITYVAMIDYGKFDIDLLEPYDGNGIDGIRMAFHKKNRFEMLELGRKIIEKGYQFFIQPMITLRYSDQELLELIECVNKELPDASGFYIVDSFGEMRPNDMNRIMNLVDHNLLPSMVLGFHSHNNLQMSYSNAVALLQFPTNRDLMLDCSIMGMGKGAGNLNTELLLEHMNLFYGKNYQTEPLLSVIDRVINQIRTEYTWGYAIEYYLSSINHCTPSYASHFYNKHMLPINQVAELLSLISEDKKISFDREYAEKLYLEYNARRKADDTKVLAHLREIFMKKRVLLIAPGKSVLASKDVINTEIVREDTVSISLNNWELFETDFVFATRQDAFVGAQTSGKRIITTTSVASTCNEKVEIIDYQKWVVVDNEVQDSSGILALNLLRNCGVSEFILAGFDGFHVNITKNYYDKTMNHPITAEQAKRRNEFFIRYLKQLRSQFPVKFLTESLYEDGLCDD